MAYKASESLPHANYGALPNGILSDPVRYIPVHRIPDIPQTVDITHDIQVARARFLAVDSNLENAPYIRTFHAGLSACKNVTICEVNSFRFWLVFDQSCTETHAGELEIHILPTLSGYLSAAGENAFFDPISECINPMLFLTDKNVAMIRHFFPKSVGARMLFSGYICILFRREKDMRTNRIRGKPTELGGLKVRTCLASHIVPAGDLKDPMGKILLEKTLILSRKLKSRIASLLSNLRPEYPAVVHKATRCLPDTKEGVANIHKGQYTSMGKKVLLASTTREIGHTTGCFDTTPSDVDLYRAYPYVFRHEPSLSEATDESLPENVPSPGFPKTQSRWKDYEKVLGTGGAPVYLCRMNAATGMEGTTVNEDTQQAIITGSEYIWDETPRDYRVALLWRTKVDTDSADC